MNPSEMPLGTYQYGEEFEIGYQNVIGIKKMRLCVKYQKNTDEFNRLPQPIIFGDRCVVCNHVVIYEGAFFGDDCFVDDYVRVGSNAKIGNGTMLLYGAKLYEDVTIGDNCRIAGFLPHKAVIGKNVTMMGTITHKYRRPLDWTRDEPSPIIEDNVVVGLGATVVGGIRIQENSYIAAGATVTKDVPKNTMVLNNNEFYTIKEFETRKSVDTELLRTNQDN